MVKISVITPNRNGARYLESCLASVRGQRAPDLEVEHIVIDGGSTDGSLDILQKHRDAVARLVSEPDRGPASAINKGLRLATGEIVGWLNADDYYFPGALQRVASVLAGNPGRALCFGHCPIVDEEGREIRRRITRFKELFFPLSSRFTIQSINYISQPAMFFRRSAAEKAGLLREDLQAAFDYDYTLRLWRHGGGVRVPGPPLAVFRWHEASISGRSFVRQFKEEYEVAASDAGRFSAQSLLHLGVRFGIVSIYSWMAWRRSATS